MSWSGLFSICLYDLMGDFLVANPSDADRIEQYFFACAQSITLQTPLAQVITLQTPMAWLIIL